MLYFDKMQGIGNDFIVVDAASVSGADLPGLARHLCNRHYGIGSDGLLVIGEGAEPRTVTYRMFNPDGSEDMCGNGLRCAMLWAYRRGLACPQHDITALCFDRSRRCHIESAADDGKSAVVTVAMGRADFAKQAIPFTGPDEISEALEFPLKINADISISITAVSTGSAHAVAFLDAPVDERIFQTISPLMEHHSFFPERASIMWTHRSGINQFDIRIWERAVGETLGCGTGSAAVAAAAWKLGICRASDPVVVRSKGGELSFSLTDSGCIRMTGSAVYVFTGRITLPL
jgi:diaminopimelate epimerase